MTRTRLLILGLIAVLIGGGGAGAMFWRGHGSAPSDLAADATAAEAAPALRFVMPLLLVPLGREGGPVVYLPVAPELHLASEADKARAELRLPHLQDHFVRAAFADGLGGATREDRLDLAALRLRLLAAARDELGETAVRDLTLTETMRQRR